MLLVPNHGFSKIEHGRKRIQEVAVPVLFKVPPEAFNGIVLTVLRRIIGQLDVELQLVSHLNHTLHELSAAAMIFWAIILL